MSRRLSKSLRCMLVFVMCFALGVFAAGCGGTGDSSGDGDAGNNGGSQAQESMLRQKKLLKILCSRDLKKSHTACM